MGRPLSANGTGAPPRILIVGAGFGGIGLGIRLLQEGVDSFQILEREDAIGGVWRDNAYPGLTCDIPSHLYSLSYEPNPDWSHVYAPRDEILAYEEKLVTKYGLGRHIRLGTEVAHAEFDDAAGAWHVTTTDGDAIEADVLVCATGQLSRPAPAPLPGLESFEGPSFHSSRWDPDVDLAGKRVAVVGTGASAIQIVPEIAEEVEHLYVFQRSAPWVVPKGDRAYSPLERRLLRRSRAFLRFVRSRQYWKFELLGWLLTQAPDRVKQLFEKQLLRRIEKEVADPELRDEVTPRYPIGCKRVLVSDDWYRTLVRPDVELVTDAVTEVRSDRIATEDGLEREVDVIVLATGFRTTEFLAPMEVTGLGGRDLNETWRDGAEAYLGMTVAGFPNFFMLYGPNTNLGVGSILTIHESQIRYLLEVLGELGRDGARYLDVRPDVQREFNDELQEQLAHSVWTAGCSNWYVTESGKVVNNWPGLSSQYDRRTRALDPDDYRIVGAS
jgi:cation diffusion facilitator CzcD-associated flavoprotein CzcO